MLMTTASGPLLTDTGWSAIRTKAVAAQQPSRSNVRTILPLPLAAPRAAKVGPRGIPPIGSHARPSFYFVARKVSAVSELATAGVLQAVLRAFLAKQVRRARKLVSLRTCHATMIKLLNVDPRRKRQCFIAAHT